MKANAAYHYYRRLLVLCALVLFTQLFPPIAYADGGAPQLAYVAGAAKGISIIDIAQRRVRGTITLDESPQTLLLSQNGSALYLAQPLSGKVTVTAASTGKTLCSVHLPGQPSLLALSLDATALYVAGSGDDNVRVLDPTTCAIKQMFSTHEPIYGLAVTASTAANATPTTPAQIWIVGSTSLTVFEADGHFLGSLPVAGGPQHICIPGGFTAYVTTRSGTIIAIDLNTQHIIQTLLRGGTFGPMDYDATTGEVYVPDQLHRQLDVLAPVTSTLKLREPVRIIHVDGSPQSVAITSDGQLGFVALANGRVIMLDIPARNSVATITVGGTPHFIITGLYPPGEATTNTSLQATPSAPDPFRLAGWLLVITVVLLFFFWLSGKQRRKRTHKRQKDTT